MDAKEGDPVFCALVYIVHPEALIAGQIINIIRGVIPAGKVLETVVGGSERVDGHEIYSHVFSYADGPL